eukprot:1877-Heterococcus_DN1.PRE.1
MNNVKRATATAANVKAAELIARKREGLATKLSAAEQAVDTKCSAIWCTSSAACSCASTPAAVTEQPTLVVAATAASAKAICALAAAAAAVGVGAH